MVVLRSTSGLHMGEFDGAEAIAALGFDRRSQQKAVFGDVNAHIRQFLGSGFLKNGSSKFRQTAVLLGAARLGRKNGIFAPGTKRPFRARPGPQFSRALGPRAPRWAAPRGLI